MTDTKTIDYYLPYCKDPPDVVLVIEKTEIPAHRSILSNHSEYFQAMFSSSFIEATSNKVVLKEINLKAFCVILICIYRKHYNRSEPSLYDVQNGPMSFEELFEILACARYLLVDFMVKVAKSALETRGKDNPGQLLNAALEYSDDEFLFSATNRMLKKKKLFDNMSATSVEYLLKERLDAPEGIIFKALVYWMRVNPYYWYLFAGFLEHIDLYLLEDRERYFNMLVEPIRLVDLNYCRKLVIQQQKEAKKVEKMENQNVINESNKLRVIEGYLESRDPEGWLQPSENNRVIIDLKKVFLINCIKLKLSATVINSVSYTVSVSTDMSNWKCVIDHLKYSCFGQQVLYFHERNVRFIRIQGKSFFFLKTHIEALYSTEPSTIDPVTTLTVPHQNMIELKDFPKWSRDMRGLLTGVYLQKGQMAHRIHRQGVMLYRFAQPYMIDSFSFLLKEESSFKMEIRGSWESGSDWKIVLHENNVSGWRVAKFKKQPVSIIQIVGMKSPTGIFHVYNFECPAYSGNN